MKTLYTILTITTLLCLSAPETAQAQYHEQGMPCNMLKAEDSLKLAGRPPMQINIGDCTDLDDPNPGGGGEEDKTEDPPFEYDIDFNNIGELLYLEGLLAAIADREEQRWLDEQEETFRNEINEIFDTHHSTFKAAQEAFFREFESETLGFERTASDEAYQHRQIAERMDTDQEVVTTELYHMEEWKGLWEFCKDWEGADCDKFGSKTVQGTRLRDIATQHQFNQLLGQAETDFAELEFDAAQERAWADGIWNMVHDGSYYESIIRARMSQYDNLSRRDRVFLMTNYILTYNYPSNAPMATPTFISDLPSYWHSETLFGLGKEMAPTPSIEALVFYPGYIEDSYNDCQSGRPKNDRGIHLGPDYCTPARTEHEAIRERVLEEHINEVAEDLSVINEVDNPCVSDMIDYLKDVNTPLKTTINEIFGSENSVYNLIYKNVDEIAIFEDGSVGVAETDALLDYNGRITKIEIRLDNNFIETATDIGIFTTLLHENLHAIMEYQLDQKSVNLEESSSNYRSLASFWSHYVAEIRRGEDGNRRHISYYMHEVMAELIEPMAELILEFGLSKNYDIDIGDAEAIAWSGLKGTEAYEEIEEEIRRIYSSFIESEREYFEILSIGKKCEN